MRLAFGGLRRRERRGGCCIGALKELERVEGAVLFTGMKDEVGRDAGIYESENGVGEAGGGNEVDGVS